MVDSRTSVNEDDDEDFPGPTAIKIALIDQPLTMSLNANDDNFSWYTDGIYNPEAADCEGSPNHTILLVGFGYDTDSALEYWIILNSWGSDWGEDGYAKVAFGIDKDASCGMCGMFCDWVSWPTMISLPYELTAEDVEDPIENTISDGSGCPEATLVVYGMTEEE